jgi:ComF family protein
MCVNYPVIETARDLCAFFLFPRTCLICGGESGSSRPICAACRDSLRYRYADGLSFFRVDASRCSRCGRPLVSAREQCLSCRTTNVLSAIDRIIPLFPYDAHGQELLTSWKIEGMRVLSWTFSAFLAEVLSRDGSMDIPLVPVPPRPGKIRANGWDQVDELARTLERHFGVSVARCLERTGGLQQKKLGRLERTCNLKGYIRVKDETAVPATAIVLDDLMTTGSTIDACADALKNAGCRKVYGLTLFFD